MAIKKGKFLTGVLGGFVFKKVNGQQVVAKRMAPGTMKQSEASKLSANTFGMASTFTSQFKKALGFTRESYVDKGLNNRLTSAMVKILKGSRDSETRKYSFHEDSFSGLTGFDFNNKSPVADLLVVPPQLNFKPGLLEVWFPYFSNTPPVMFPKKSMKCKLTINVTLFRLMDGLMSAVANEQSIVILNEKKVVKQDALTFTIPDGCLCVATLFLEYAAAGKNDWRIVNGVNFNPCCILGTRVIPGIYENDYGRLWNDMIRFDG